MPITVQTILLTTSAFYCLSTKFLVTRAEFGSWERDRVIEFIFLFLFACRFNLGSCSWYVGDTEWRWVCHSSLSWTQASIPWSTVGMNTQCSSSWIKNLECKFGKLRNSVPKFKIRLAPCSVGSQQNMRWIVMRWDFRWDADEALIVTLS